MQKCQALVAPDQAEPGAARKLKRAQILLAADAGCSDEEIARTATTPVLLRPEDPVALHSCVGTRARV
jgi:hypothetical protein